MQKHPSWKIEDVRHLTIYQTFLALGISQNDKPDMDKHEARWNKVFMDVAAELNIAPQSVPYWPRGLIIEAVSKVTGEKTDPGRVRVALMKWKPNNG